VSTEQSQDYFKLRRKNGSSRLYCIGEVFQSQLMSMAEKLSRFLLDSGMSEERMHHLF
jgi:hypothetical protein